MEPGWQRPEFVDYLVQQKIFTYSLKSTHKGLGSTLLMLLAFGPPALREFIFALRLGRAPAKVRPLPYGQAGR